LRTSFSNEASETTLRSVAVVVSRGGARPMNFELVVMGTCLLAGDTY